MLMLARKYMLGFGPEHMIRSYWINEVNRWAWTRAKGAVNAHKTHIFLSNYGASPLTGSEILNPEHPKLRRSKMPHLVADEYGRV